MIEIVANGKNVMNIKDNGETEIHDDEIIKEIKESLQGIPSNVIIKDEE